MGSHGIKVWPYKELGYWCNAKPSDFIASDIRQSQYGLLFRHCPYI
jgi:hypothetical protein